MKRRNTCRLLDTVCKPCNGTGNNISRVVKK